MEKPNSNSREPIPEAIKREVRQRCGFGCVICGLPLYEYEHMLEWANVKRHKADEITLLCREHHGQKTSGLLPVKDVINADKNPHNLKEGVSKSLLLNYSGNTDISFKFGKSILPYPDLPEGAMVIPIVIDDIPIISFTIKSGNLFINFLAFDETNELIFQIVENEVVYSTEQWDIEWISNRLTIRENKGAILLRLEFNPPNNITILNARILCNGVEVHMRKNFIACLNNNIYIGQVTVEGYAPPQGFVFGRRNNYSPCVLYASNIPRYNVDRKKALKWLKESIRGRPHINQDEEVDIEALQKKLANQGYYKGEIDGILSEEVKNALREFMKNDEESKET